MARRSEFRTPRGTRLPTTRTQFARHAVPEVESSRAGMEQMGAVFRSFFNDATAALGELEDAKNIEKRAEIEVKNSEEAAQGAADAYAGRGPNASLQNDMDYMEAFRGIRGSRLGRDAANDFNQWYLDEYLPNNPHGDVASAREEWASENLGGIEDPEMAATVYDQFYRGTDSTVSSHGENSVRIQAEEDMMQMGAEIAAEVRDGTLNVERIQWYINAARELDPTRPQNAAPRVIARLLEGAQQYPGRTEQVIGLLEQDGTGMNGQSFAESFPEAFNDFQEGALTSYLQTNTLEEADVFTGIEESIAGAQNMEELSEAMVRLNAAHGIYGSGRRYEQLRNAAAGRLEEFAETQANMSQVAGMLQGAVPADPSFMREHFMDWFETANGTRSILEVEDPAVAAVQIAATNGAVPSDVSHQLSAALLNSSDPEAQARAFQILNGISQVRDGHVSPYLNSEAKRFWDNIGLRRSTGQPISQIIADANTGRAQDINPQDVDWMEVTGADTAAEAQTEINSMITAGVNNYLGTNGWFDGDGDVTLPPNVTRQIRNYLQVAVAEGMTRNQDIDAVIERGISTVMENVHIGGTRENPVLFLGDSADTGPDGEAPIRLGYDVVSPVNGTRVNTREIYENELEDMGETAPWVVPDGNFEDITVTPSASQPGRYEVRDSTGSLIQFSADETVTWDGVNYSFNTEDPEVLEQMFGDAIPEGFGFVRVNTVQGPGWQLMYQPHLGERGSTTTEDLSNNFGYDGSMTPADALASMQNDMIGRLREEGLTQPGLGVSGNPPAPENGQDILDLIEEQSWRGVSWNGRSVITRERRGEASYRTARREIFVGSDGIQNRVNGNSGSRTVGIGFDMEAEGARETWEEVFDGAVDFDAVMSGQEEITDQEARDLFDYEMVYYERMVSAATGGEALPEHRHLALLSLAKRNPDFLQVQLASDIQAGNHGAVMEAILYEGLGDNPSSSQVARRYREAAQYAGSNQALTSILPTPEEYIRSSQLGLGAATPMGSTTHGEGFVNGVIGSLTGSESSGDPTASNDVPGSGGTGHFGLLQFSRARFNEAKAAGVVPAGMTIEQFATEENVDVQHAANRWHVEDIISRAEADGLTRYVGQRINGVEVTMSGMIAVAHLGGYEGLKDHLSSGGSYNPSDANGTSLSHYMRSHGGIGGYGNSGRRFSGNQEETHSSSSTGGGQGMIIGTDGTPEPQHFREMQPLAQERFRGLSAAFGQPLQITPHGGRSPRRSQTSRHVHGDAMDIYVADMSPQERTHLIALAISMGATGIGGYEPGSGSDGVGTIHIDFRPRGGNGPEGVAQWWRTAGGDVGYTQGARWFREGINQGLQLYREGRG